VRTLPGKIKTYIFAVVHKTYSSVHLTATLSNLNRFQQFLLSRNGKEMSKTGHAACVPQHSHERRRAARASDLCACELDQSVVNHAIDNWKHRLLACVDAEGGHFEHYL